MDDEILVLRNYKLLELTLLLNAAKRHFLTLNLLKNGGRAGFTMSNLYKTFKVFTS